jgi:hypothetical protein
VRGASGAAGSATYVLDSADDIEELSHQLTISGRSEIFLVEEMVDVLASPNVQMHIDAATGAIEYVGASDQILSDSLVHSGNAYPSDARSLAEMIGWAHTVARWLRDAGFTGMLGLDFVEYSAPDGNRRAFLAEVNPRVNGATYPLALQQRLGGSSAFVSGTFDLDVSSFEELQSMLSDILYTSDRSAGIIPYATGCLRQGKCPVIALAPSREEAAELMDLARQLVEDACLASR